MNSTHEKFFVRRNIKNTGTVYRDVECKYNRSIKTAGQINENILLNGMTGKLSNDKLLERDNAESLHKQFKPLLIVLRLLGCLPVYFSNSGSYKHAYNSQTHIHTQTHKQIYDRTFKIPYL